MSDNYSASEKRLIADGFEFYREWFPWGRTPAYRKYAVPFDYRSSQRDRGAPVAFRFVIPSTDEILTPRETIARFEGYSPSRNLPLWERAKFELSELPE